MFPLLIPMAIGAFAGAMSNKRNPLKGAVMGAGMGALGGAAAPAIGGLFGGAASGAGAAAGGAAGGASGAAGGAAGGASGLLGTMGQYAQPIMSVASQSGLLGGGEQQPTQGATPLPVNNAGAQTLTSLAQSGDQQVQNELLAAEQERRKRRVGLLGEQ